MNEKTKEFYALLSDLRNNYTHGVTTISECCNEGCKNPARGGDCTVCLTKEIGELIDDKNLAMDILLETSKINRLINKALEKVKL